MKKLITIQLELKEDVGKAELKSYLADAILHWSGGYHPEDDMFDNIKDNIKIKVSKYTVKNLLKQI